MTNPDINVKLERGKCETVRFSLTVRDYNFFFSLHGKFFGSCSSGDQAVSQDGCLKITNIWGYFEEILPSNGNVKRIIKVQKVQRRYISMDLSRVVVNCFPLKSN